MTTLATATLERTQPSFRAFAVSVDAVERLSPSFVRVTFVGEDLDLFGRAGLDQRIKVVFPDAAGRAPSVDDFAGENWYQAWRALPEDARNPFRTYTVRATRSADRSRSGRAEVDVDFVLHGTAGHDATASASGPASRWVEGATVGAGAVLVGPNALYEGPAVGIEWAPPATATTLLLAGDETAAPAITSIIETLPAGTRAHVFLEVPEAGDALPVAVPDGVSVTWLPRAGADGTRHDHGVLLDAAVRDCMSKHVADVTAADAASADAAARRAVEPEEVDIDAEILWDVPASHDAPGVPALADCYAWIAGEAAVIRDLRRHLVRDLGIDRRSVAFMGYWRRGRAEC